MRISGGGIFPLARIAMLRAMEINQGAKPLVEYEISEKSTTIALREIAQGKVAFKPGTVVSTEIKDADPFIERVSEENSEKEIVVK